MNSGIASRLAVAMEMGEHRLKPRLVFPALVEGLEYVG
jgi:hypothetical protein